MDRAQLFIVCENACWDKWTGPPNIDALGVPLREREPEPAPPPPAPPPQTTPVVSDNAGTLSVPLKKRGGLFTVPVEINGAMTLDFGVDSGATDVSIPQDVYSTLKRLGAVSDSDTTGHQTYELADGSRTQGVTFRIRSLKIGGKVFDNVDAGVSPATGSLLLGQSFLGRFKTWSIDNAQQRLVLVSQ